MFAFRGTENDSLMSKTPFQLKVTEDPCPELIVERGPNNEGVGKWVPQQKHVLLAKMIGGTRGARAKWSNRILIDPFCGPGRIQVKGESFTRDGGTIVAWRQASQHNVAFTKVLIGDLEETRVMACETRLRTLGAPVKAFVGSAADTVKHMRSEVPDRALCLAYIDPYNLEHLSFSIIEELAKLKNVDFAVHFSTMDMIRNVDMELDPDRARFDDAAPQWRAEIGNDRLSKSQLHQAFFAYWKGLVERCNFKFSKEMPLVTNDQNRPIYRLVFFSRHSFPNEIWDDVAKSPNLELDF
jgi:three-Cys-motif partner protein